MHQAKMFGSWRLFKQIETHHISHMYDRFDRVSMSRFFMTEMRSLELRLKQAVRKRGMELDPQDSVSRFWNMEHDVFVHTHATSFSGKGPVSLRQGNCCRSMSRRRPAMRVKEEIKGLAVRLCKRLVLFHSNDFVKSWEASRLFSFGNLANLSFPFISHFSHFPPDLFFDVFAFWLPSPRRCHGNFSGGEMESFQWTVEYCGHGSVAPSRLSCEILFRRL